MRMLRTFGRYAVIFFVVTSVGLMLIYMRQSSLQDTCDDDNKAVEFSLSRKHAKTDLVDDGARDLPIINRKLRIMKKFGLEQLIAENVSSRDPRLLKAVKELMDPPSTRGMVVPRPIFRTPQAEEIMKIFAGRKRQQQPLFYVECGAQDGERSSNTIALDRAGWDGVLIEADSYMYTQLLGKNRRAWSINACLSPTNKTEMMQFSPLGGLGHLVMDGLKDTIDDPAKFIKVPCFTLETIMFAVQQKRIDYFSLDVEGIEYQVLQAIPYHDLDIRSLSIEYPHLKIGTSGISKFLHEKGFKYHKKIDKDVKEVNLVAHDLIFVKN